MQWVKAYFVAWPVAAIDRVLRHAAGAPPDRADRRPDRRPALMLSALDLARRIEAGELTPRAVIDLLRAGDRARARPRSAPSPRSTSRRRGAARERPELARAPLRGLPVGIKDIFDTADFPTAYGSPIYAGHRPKADAAMVMMVRRARRHRARQDGDHRIRLARSRPARAIRAIPRTRRAARPRARRRRSRPACCRSHSAARPAAR